MKRLNILLLLLFILCSTTSQAIETLHPKYNMERLTTTEGLSQNDVQEFMQDSYGFVWVATNDGLCRYDGMEFVNYGIGDRGLTSNLILSICEDDYHNLWIGCADKGLFYYLRKENRFIHASEMGGNEIIKDVESACFVCKGAEGELWFYARLTKSVIRVTYDVEQLQITAAKHYPVTTTTNAYAHRMIYLEGELFFSAPWGLLHYTPESDQFTQMKNFASNTRDIQLHDNKLFIATTNKLFSYNPTTKEKQQYNLFSGHHLSWDADTLYQATATSLHKSVYNPTTEVFSTPQLIDQYENFNIRDMITVRTGGIWVGFTKEAICIYQRNQKPFKLLEGFGNNHITPIFRDREDRYWIGTENNGYFVQEQIDTSTPPLAHHLAKFTVNSITYAPYNDQYYIASGTGVFTQSEPTADPIAIDTRTTIRDLLADGKYLWAASYGMGLVRYDLESGEIYTIDVNNSAFTSDIVREVIKDRSGDLWIATSKGLYTIDAEEKWSKAPQPKAVAPEITGDHYIVPLYESRAGEIWYGTLGSGLHCVTHQKQGYNVQSYSKRDILPNNTVCAITEDNEGRLWVSHNSGLCVIDADKGDVRNFDTSNGLKEYGFQESSISRMKSGKLLFGGATGITLFDPQEIVPNQTQGVPRLTDFKIFNRSILNSDHIAQLTGNKSLEEATHLELAYNQNSFAFLFSGFNYTDRDKQTYAYKLEGFDKEWITIESSNREVSYTNISHGNYQFRLRHANGDGVWNSKELLVKVTVNPPIWLTWYAYTFYIALIIAAFLLFMYFYRGHIQREQNALYAMQEKQRVEEMLTIQTNFVTNVSHEFRTPLTLILSPLQLILGDERIKENKVWMDGLRTIKYNSEALLRLVNEFLSFTKRATQELTLQPIPMRFDTLVEGAVVQFVYFAQSKGVRIHYSNEQATPIAVACDKGYMEQILNNLLSNAIKHTPSGGSVTVAIVEQEGVVQLSVEDSGAGIPLEMQPHIYDRFFTQASAASKGTISGIGIGLSLTKELVELHKGTISFVSTPQVGTTFTVTLPALSDAVLSEEERVERSVTAEEWGEQPPIATTAPTCSDERATMLVVDDNPRIVKLLQTLFQGEFNLLSASDGAEALEIAGGEIPDIILSDVMMPVMDGYELCDQIKENRNLSHIPVLLLTAKSGVDDIAAGYSHKADGYCTKPFDNAVLMAQVKALLHNRRMLAERLGKGVVQQGEQPLEQSEIITEQDKQLLKRVKGYIEENLSNSELKVADICQEVGLTQIVLNKKLKSLLDMTTKALITSIRLKRAAQLLSTGRYTVTSVTYDTGFNDLRNFREMFKREYGVFPQEYKKTNSPINEENRDKEE